MFLSPNNFDRNNVITFSTKASRNKSVVLKLTWPKPSNKHHYQIITSTCLFKSSLLFQVHSKINDMSKQHLASRSPFEKLQNQELPIYGSFEMKNKLSSFKEHYQKTIYHSGGEMQPQCSLQIKVCINISRFFLLFSQAESNESNLSLIF